MNQLTKAPFPPCILGIVTADMLVHNRYPDALWRCGGIELRADGIAPGDIAGAVADFDAGKGRRGFTGPVIFTLRLQRDGGAWADADSRARNAVWESLPPGTCDWVDLEIEETGRVAPESLDALRSSGVKILLSHHAFTAESPDEWVSRLEAMKSFGPDGVKFAVALADRQGAGRLLAFARKVAEDYPESCVLGMGSAGALTRLLSPLLGCPYTYGFTGDGAVAPGQLSAEAMGLFFARAAEDGFPGAGAPDEALLDWADALLKRVSGA